MNIVISLFFAQLIACVAVAVIMAAVIYLIKWIVAKTSGGNNQL